MKKIETHIHKYGIRYKCEKCLNLFSRESKALECEEIHACEHDYQYKLHLDDRDPQYLMSAIRQYCRKCEHTKDSFDIGILSASQEALKKLYMMVSDEYY